MPLDSKQRAVLADAIREGTDLADELETKVAEYGRYSAHYPVSSTANLGTNESVVTRTFSILDVVNALMFRAPFSHA